jgi:hypothetical protein
MPSGTSGFRQGRIIGAYLRTRKGRRELHPAAVLTPNPEIIQPERFDPRSGDENLIVVIGISTKDSLYPDTYVKLPFHPSGHPQTRLTKDAAAIIGWYDRVSIPDECQFMGGDVPPELLGRIIELARTNIAGHIGSDSADLAKLLRSLFD